MTNNNRLAVITGGTTGIGRGISLRLAEAGWVIAVNNLEAEDASALQLVREVEAMGGRAWYAPCDVGDSRSVDRFFHGLTDHFQQAPNLLVNNAGIQTWAPLLDLAEEDWDRVINTNLKGCFLNTQRAARLMVEAGSGGSIVNIGSGCNKLAFPRLVDYAASKGGIEMLTKASAIELGEYGIRVNCVAPGGVLVERTEREAPDYAASWSAITPLGRVGYARDIADAVLFLAGEESSFISGQTLWVDGGAFSKANWPYANTEETVPDLTREESA
ncbi:SDR family oxidoreductase [Microbulbifer thermotolerans]|uniref:SDR family NAD(P)-dependent oxidoreductase n=1 Tax=Microbulbifer thermotolerans TaxID=252514 RepID=UPI00224B2194|nr:SDR family NAD(P)-dependent oxidoreductase [Microbulbifer thermotolerans]MCX2783699.1 SDR family oxidoreductase [Microbulbifer thermotolerans]